MERFRLLRHLKKFGIVWSVFSIIGITFAPLTPSVSGAPSVARIGVSLWTPWLGVSDFVPGETVTLSVDVTNNGSVDFMATQVVNEFGGAQFNLGSLQIQYGSLVTAQSSTFNKTLTVPEVRVEYVNAVSNVASGFGPANTSLFVTVEQAGPPLASAMVTTDSSGQWSHDFTGAYDIEDNREVAAEITDADGDSARAMWRAVVPSVAVGYSQIGANSLFVRQFAPGTSVRVRVDFANDGGPLSGFDYDQTAVTTNPFGFGFNIGGFDVLHLGDRVVATGGGWSKELLTAPLRIERADASTEVVNGIASSGSQVAVGISPLGGGGPADAMLTVTANTEGVWLANFSSTYDLAPNQNVSAEVSDADGDSTFTTWRALTAYFSASVTDGPPSQVSVINFAAGTEVRLQVDYGNNGSVDVDETRSITNTWGDTFNLGGSGLLHPGDLITVTGGGWTKSGVLAPLSLDVMSFVNDSVSGTATAGAQVRIDINPPPGSPGGPPVASLVVMADSSGQWVANFSGSYDIVENQDSVVSISDSDGDLTQALGWARVEQWPKSGFEYPIKNLPLVNVQKAGSTIPVKFSLGGDRGFEIFKSGYPKFSIIECGTFVETNGDTTIETAGRTTLSYNAYTDQYELKWRTQKNWKGSCRQLVLYFADNSYLRANFRFT